MKKNKLILYTVFGSVILTAIFISPQSIVFAADGATIQNPLGSATTLRQVLAVVISTVQVIAGILSVVFIILAGLKFVLAAGNPAKITEARKMLLYVVIGVAIIFGAQAISLVVQNTITQVGSGK